MKWQHVTARPKRNHSRRGSLAPVLIATLLLVSLSGCEVEQTADDLFQAPSPASSAATSEPAAAAEVDASQDPGNKYAGGALNVSPDGIPADLAARMERGFGRSRAPSDWHCKKRSKRCDHKTSGSTQA